MSNKPDYGARKMKFKDFQALVTHGLIGLTTKEIAVIRKREPRRLDEWLEALCLEVLEHGRDLKG